MNTAATRLYVKLGFSFMLVIMLSACKTELYTGLSEREANLMIATLMNQGVPAGRTVQDDGLVTVTVSESDFSQAVDILNSANLPQPRFDSLRDVFQGGGLVSSPMQERARMAYALSQELSNTVSQIDGVRSARVQVVLPDNDLMRGDGTPSSASVFISHTPSLEVEDLIPHVKTLVANGISGLDYDGVSVVPIAVSDNARSEEVLTVSMTTFMGVVIPASSVVGISWLIGIPIAISLLLAAALILVLWRLRRDRPYELKS